MPPLTPDQLQGMEPLSEAEIYAMEMSPEDTWRIARLCGELGYPYLAARTLSPDHADWFLALHEETGI
jgi:hypothetical protein